MLDNGWFAFKRYGSLTFSAVIFAASFAGQYLHVRRKIADNILTGETIPIRLFLGGFDLTPTFREVNKKYSTRYYLSLVLIDEGEQISLRLVYLCYLLVLPVYTRYRIPEAYLCMSWEGSLRCLSRP